MFQFNGLTLIIYVSKVSRTMTTGFRPTNKTTPVILGKLSSFNVWSHALSQEEILRMSHGCGSEAGDVTAWKTVRKGFHKEVAVKWLRTCSDRKGKSSKI